MLADLTVDWPDLTMAAGLSLKPAGLSTLAVDLTVLEILVAVGDAASSPPGRLQVLQLRQRATSALMWPSQR